MSCALIRTRLPDLRTLPSRIVATLSFCAIVGMSTFAPLKLNAEVRDTTRKPRIFDSTLSNSSARPSAKYSLAASSLVLTKGRTAIEGLSVMSATGGFSMGCVECGSGPGPDRQRKAVASAGDGGNGG